MSFEEKIKFIKFCWAQKRLASSEEEYVKNQIEFTIKAALMIEIKIGSRE